MRRRERKQFKLDRAQAILNASLAAEALLTGAAADSIAPADASDTPTGVDALARTDSRASIPSTAAGLQPLDSDLFALPKGHTRLTPQTFLQRPTRPGVRPAGLPRPPPKARTEGQGPPADALADGLKRAEELGEEDQEHLQLCMEEAVFLAWGIGCLRVLDRESVRGRGPAPHCQR